MANLTPLFVNGWSTTLSASVPNGTATSFSLTSATGLPTIGTNQYIPAVVVDTSTSPETMKEYVYITAVSGTTATVTRAAEDSGTYAAAALASGLTVAAVTTRDALGSTSATARGFTPRHAGFLVWSWDPTISNSSTAPTRGQTQLVRIDIPATMKITNVVTYLVSGGTTLTAGQNFAALYDSSGNQIGITADQSTAWAGMGLVSMALTTPVTVSGGTFVWVAMLFNGSAAPTLYKTTQGDTAFGNLGLTVSTARYARNGGALTAMPASITLSNNIFTANTWWVALS